MTISTVLIWFLIATAIVVAIPSMWMVCYALAPTRTQDYRDTASCGVIPNLLIGLIPAVVTFFGVAAILQARKGPAVGLVGFGPAAGAIPFPAQFSVAASKERSRSK